jgi:protein ImuB
MIARHRPPEFYAEQLLDYPTSHQETIEVIIERLIGRICAALSAAQQGALQWTIRLYGQHKLPLKLYVSLFQPTATADHVVPLAKMQLDQMLQPNVRRKSRHKPSNRKPGTRSNIKLDGQPIEVHEIAVAVTSCVLLTHRQRKLFDENPRLDRPALAHLINRLAGRLGRQQVVYPTIVAGAQPEQAFEFRPLVNPHRRGPRRTAAKTTSPSGSHVMARPLTMFQPAIALETVSTKHQRCQPVTPPALLVHSSTRHSIINHWGPERIETGWWLGPTVRRDYWRVETETHQQFWIYYDLQKRSWFLQGEF